MAAEEPEVRIHVEFGPHQALAVLASGFGDLGDAIEHRLKPLLSPIARFERGWQPRGRRVPSPGQPQQALMPCGNRYRPLLKPHGWIGPLCNIAVTGGKAPMRGFKSPVVRNAPP